MSWAPAVVPDGAQDGQAALGANGAEQGQALEVGEGQHNSEAADNGAGDRVGGSEECLQEMCSLEGEGEETSPACVRMQRRRLSCAQEAQEPGLNDVSFQDQGRYGGSKVRAGVCMSRV